MFDRFAKSDRSRASGGSGLGLAITRAHARAQGGDLTAHNALGAGARFSLRLPATEDADAPVEPADPGGPATRARRADASS